MRDEIKHKLDSLQIKDRRKKIIYVIISAFILLLTAAYTVTIETRTVYGVTEGYTEGDSYTASVELESGERVLATFPKDMLYLNKSQVQVLERHSLLRVKTYVVVQYVREKHNNSFNPDGTNNAPPG